MATLTCNAYVEKYQLSCLVSMSFILNYEAVLENSLPSWKEKEDGYFIYLKFYLLWMWKRHRYKYCDCMHVCSVASDSFRPYWLYVAHQVPLPMEFSRQESWSGLPFPPPGDLPDPGMEPASLASPALTGRFFTTCDAPLCVTWKINTHVYFLSCESSVRLFHTLRYWV